MDTIAWVTLPIFLLLYASFVRLSGKILKITGLYWKDCLYFSLFMFFLVVIVRAPFYYWKIKLPLYVFAPLLTGSQLAFGSIYLGKSVKDHDGESIGNYIGFKITVLTTLLLLMTAGILYTYINHT